MRHVGWIGGTGTDQLVPAEAVEQSAAPTPYGAPSSPLLGWRVGDCRVSFIARHGLDGNIPPHLVNYRANVHALAAAGPDSVIAINAVGGIAPQAVPGTLVVPDQLIDYTWGRSQTFFDGRDRPRKHAEFGEPFAAALRQELIGAARSLELTVMETGTYGVTQGPRLESVAEIDRLERDGCDIVGMTAMPEAGLARELDMAYAICAVVVNRAAGRTPAGLSVHDEIEQFLAQGLAAAQGLLRACLTDCRPRAE